MKKDPVIKDNSLQHEDNEEDINIKKGLCDDGFNGRQSIEKPILCIIETSQNECQVVNKDITKMQKIDSVVDKALKKLSCT